MLKVMAKKLMVLSAAVLLFAYALCSGYIGQAGAGKAASDLPVIAVRNNEGKPINISIEDVGKYHGDICPCVLFAYRAIQSAVERLWADEMPYRSDIRMITPSTSPGARDAFEFIARAVTRPERRGDFRVEEASEESRPDRDAHNFAYTFIRKSTDERLEVRVKDAVFPEGFLRMKQKRTSQALSPSERERFEELKRELMRKVVGLPPEELFTFREVNRS